MKILHLSDIHFRRELGTPDVLPWRTGDNVYLRMLSNMRNPLVFLYECLQKSLDDIDLIVITGDLTENGCEEDYAFLRKYLDEKTSGIPIAVTLGNHDNKDNFRIGFLGESKKDNRPERYNNISYVDGLPVISLDSSIEGVADGDLSLSQLNWLKEALSDIGDTPSLLITHHHLLPSQGQVPPLPQSSQLVEVLKSSNVCAVLCGHSHFFHQDYIGSIPCCSADSLSFFGVTLQDGKVKFSEKYGYSVYNLEDGKLRLLKHENFLGKDNLATIRF